MLKRTKLKGLRKLDALTEEQRTWVLEIASHSRMIDVTEALKEHGIIVSVSTVSRYLKRFREKELLEEGVEMDGAVSALAERGQDGKLRKGTMEAVRQRFCERVLTSNDPEEALALYNSMLKEESKLRELEIEARKVSVAEEQVRLQRLKMREASRIQGVVESSKEEVVVVEGSATTAELGMSEREDRERRLLMLAVDLDAIANRGGACEEKVVALRSRLQEERKLLGNGG